MKSMATIYTGENATGSANSACVQKGQRYGSLLYDQWYPAMRWEAGMGHVRSVRVAAVAAGTACLVGLGWSGNTAWPDGGTTLAGSIALIQRSSQKSYDTPVNIETVNPDLFGFSAPHDVVVINTWRPNRLFISQNIKTTVEKVWPQIRDGFLSADSDLSVHKGPGVDWIWHEEGVQYLIPHKPYAHVKVIFNYSPSGLLGTLFSDYKVDVSLFFDFSVSNGTLAVAVHRYEYKVSPGKLNNYVKTLAKLALELAVMKLNVEILPKVAMNVNQQLQSQGLGASDAFLLPGALATPGFMKFDEDKDLALSTQGDATLVLEVGF